MSMLLNITLNCKLMRPSNEIRILLKPFARLNRTTQSPVVGQSDFKSSRFLFEYYLNCNSPLKRDELNKKM